MSAATQPGGPRRLVELFAGIGLAAEAFGTKPGGGWQTVLANDICPRKAALYRLNHPDAPLVEADITTLRADAIPEAHAWWASSPCQDVSTAGLREGVIRGEHSSLAFNVVKLLRAAVQRRAAPGVVIFENVPGLLCNSAEFEVLVLALQGCGYRAGAVVMDADRWLPASRARVFLVGVRKEIAIPPVCLGTRPQAEWSKPALVRAHDRLDPEAQRNWVWWSMPAVNDGRPGLSSLLEKGTAGGQWLGSAATGRFLSKLNRSGQAELERAMKAGKGVLGVTVEKTDLNPDPGGGRERVSVFRRDIAFTLLASATGTSRQRLVHVDGTRVRLREFTPREVARLMGVPDSFRVPNTIGKAMTAFGDGVAVPVIKHLVRHLIEPLVDSASLSSRTVQRMQTGEWRRPIRTKTVGMVTYLAPDAHARLKAQARKDGLPLAELVLKALDLLMASQGSAPLPRYSSPRAARGAAAARLPRRRPGTAETDRGSAMSRRRPAEMPDQERRSARRKS